MNDYMAALGARWRGLAWLVGWSLLEGVPAFFSGRLVAEAVDRGFGAGEPLVGVGWLAVFAAMAVLGALGSRLVPQTLSTVLEPVRDEVLSTAVRGVLHGARRAPDGIIRHVEVVRDATAGLLVQSRSLLVTATAAMGGLAATAAELSPYAIVPVLASLALFVVLLPVLARRQQELALAEERVAASAGTVLAGLRDVTSCGGERAAVHAITMESKAQTRAMVRLGTVSAGRTLLVGLGGFVPLALILAVAPQLVADGVLTHGAFVGTVVYLVAALQPAARGLAETSGAAVLRLVVALRRLAEFTPPMPRSSGSRTPNGYGISVRRVSFGWSVSAEPVVRDLDLEVPAGGHLAIVGASGTGKSTLTGLLTGMIPPSRGDVLLGGVPLPELRPDIRHHVVLLIPQDPYVFAGSVRENLALLSPDVGDGQLLAAAVAVGAGGLVRRLGGLDGQLAHGGRGLSAGEAQLIALARGYASPARVVVLDEATAHLDAATEAEVERAFGIRGGTLVVVAHRPDSALRARQVLFLDGDRTLLGTHEELLGRSARYATMTQAWPAEPGLPRTLADDQAGLSFVGTRRAPTTPGEAPHDQSIGPEGS